MNEDLKPSLIETASGAKRALILGVGGGGDIIQGIPVAHLMRQLGLERIYLGGVACQWWTPDGNPLASEWGQAVMGPTLYDVDELTDSTALAPYIRQVTASSAVGGRRPCEAYLADMLPADVVFVAGQTGGAAGLGEGLGELVAREQIDLVVGVDIGSDTFFDGGNAMPAKTSLVDFLSLAAILSLDVPSFYGMAGYGCDGEMPLEELDERVARVMAAGGYVDAIGITQRDAAVMEQACERYGDPVEPMAYRAARGDHGWKNVWTHGPWGTAVKVTPLAAVMLLFDPATMAAVNSTGITALAQSTSLAEAERIFRDELGQYPESLLHPVIEFFPGD